MSTIVLVDDPTFTGKGQAPQIVRSWAMRKLFEQGEKVGDIARRYGLTYAEAYRAVNPPRQNEGKTKTTSKGTGQAGRPKAPSAPVDITKVKTSVLLRTATAKGARADDPRVIAAVEELDRRDPKWYEK